MEEQEQDVTIVAAVSGIVGVIIGYGLAKRYRRNKAQRELDARLNKLRVVNALDVELREWVAENLSTMEHDAFWAQLNEKAQFIRMVAREG